MKTPSAIDGGDVDDVDELALESAFDAPPCQPVEVAGRRRRATTSTSTVSARKRVKPTPVKTKAAKKTKDDIYNDPDRILGPTKSPLYKQDLSLLEILYHPKAQATLEASPEGCQIAALSPEDLSRAAAAFKDDGLSGKHDPTWLADAHVAHAERHAGRFDEFLNHKFQEQWGESNEEITDSEDDEVSNEHCNNHHNEAAHTSSANSNEQINHDGGEPKKSLAIDDRHGLSNFHEKPLEEVGNGEGDARASESQNDGAASSQPNPDYTMAVCSD